LYCSKLLPPPSLHTSVYRTLLFKTRTTPPQHHLLGFIIAERIIVFAIAARKRLQEDVRDGLPSVFICLSGLVQFSSAFLVEATVLFFLLLRGLIEVLPALYFLAEVTNPFVQMSYLIRLFFNLV